MSGVDYQALGERIKSWRKKRGYTQAEFAEVVEYSVQHISNIENGSAKMSLECIIHIANGLGASLDDLLCESLKFKEIESEQEWLRDELKNASDKDKRVLKKSLSLVKLNIEEILDMAE